MDKMKKVFARFFLAFFCVAIFFAQESRKFPSDHGFLNRFVSKTWTTEDGLPGMSVTALLQGRDGYIYIGTYDGLVRFDGIEFTVFNRSVDEKYDFASVHALFQDSKDNIWIGHNDEGISCLTPDGKIFKYTKADGIPNNKINAICEDFDHNIWVGTASGIFYIAPTGEAVIPPCVHDTGREKLVVSNLFCDSSKRIWITTGDRNEVFFIKNNKLEVFHGLKKISDPAIFSVNQDKSGALWFGVSPNYVVKLKDNQEKVYDISHDGITATVPNEIMFDEAGHVWICSDSGLTIIHDGKFTYHDKSTGLSDNGITAILEDNEGNIWLGLNRGGLQKLSFGKFRTVPLGVSVNAICEDKARNVTWIGTDTGVLCYKNNEFVENELTQMYKGTRVRHVTRTYDGEILVSAFSKTIPQCSLRPDGTIKIWSVSDGILSERCRVSMKSSSGDYYFGTVKGISIIHKDGSVSFLNKKDGMSNDYIMWLFEDKKSQIWVGTNGGGIYILKDNAIVENYNTDTGLAGNVIFKILDIEGKIWVGTGTGLSQYIEETGSFVNFNSKNGLGTDSAFQIICDKNELAWILTNKGILSVPMTDFDDIASGKKTKLSVQIYGKTDGLVTGGATSTAYSEKDSSGKIWFTLVDGFAIYDPYLVNKKMIPPKIKIQKYSIDNEVYEYKGEKIVIPPTAKRLSIKYTALDFAAPEKLVFSTKLQNFDDSYSDWSNSRVVSYTNLKPGTYQFSVHAKNIDGLQNKMVNPVTIIMYPYIWQLAWFWILVGLGSAMLFYFLYRLKIKSIQKKAQEEKEFTNKIIGAFAKCVDGKDKYTNGHSIRVAKYTKMLAEKLGEPSSTVEEFYNVALLHDIGKISIPDAILNKPGKLDDDEFIIMKSHAQRGYEILKNVNLQDNLAQGAHYHHERFDGKGYPKGLSGESIPWVARIIAVADAFDAMSSTRPYRKKLELGYIVSEIKKCSGTQFDPKVVEKFIALFEEGAFSDLM